MVRIPRVGSEVIRAAATVPRTMAGSAYRNGIPKTNAAAHPLHAPVIGNGTATKRKSPTAPSCSPTLQLPARPVKEPPEEPVKEGGVPDQEP